MARAQRVLCDFCPNGRIDIGSAFCADCGAPTVWASHDDRVQWEVGQWRRTRTAQREGEPHLSSVATIARPAPPPAPEPASKSERASVMSMPPLEVVEPKAASRPSPLAWFREFWHHLRERFDSPIAVPADVLVQSSVASEPEVAPVDKPVLVEPIPLFVPEVEVEPEPESVAEAAAPEPVALAEAVVETPASEPSVEKPAAEPGAQAAAHVIPVPAVAEAPVVVAKPKPPRKRPQRPTNKEMLKSALDVLKKVDERLEHVETELAEIDEAVRTKRDRRKARAGKPQSEATIDIEQLPL